MFRLKANGDKEVIFLSYGISSSPNSTNGEKNQQQPSTQLCGGDGETDMRPCPMGEM